MSVTCDPNISYISLSDAPSSLDSPSLMVMSPLTISSDILKMDDSLDIKLPLMSRLKAAFTKKRISRSNSASSFPNTPCDLPDKQDIAKSTSLFSLFFISCLGFHKYVGKKSKKNKKDPKNPLIDKSAPLSSSALPDNNLFPNAVLQQTQPNLGAIFEEFKQIPLIKNDSYLPLPMNFKSLPLSDALSENRLLMECQEIYFNHSYMYRQTVLKRFNDNSTIKVPPRYPLLPPLGESCSKDRPLPKRKLSLIIDLDETLIHCTFRQILPNADWVLGELAGPDCVSVCKRPGAIEFLRELSQYYELVIFTASLSTYANAVIDLLDPQRQYITHRLFRESCVLLKGLYIKDLTLLGRPLQDVLIIDNSPFSYLFQPHHAIPISTWFSDPNDTNLFALIPWMKRLAELAWNDNAPLSYYLKDIKSVLKGTHPQILSFSNLPIVQKDWHEIVRQVSNGRDSKAVPLESSDVATCPLGSDSFLSMTSTLVQEDMDEILTGEDESKEVQSATSGCVSRLSDQNETLNVKREVYIYENVNVNGHVSQTTCICKESYQISGGGISLSKPATRYCTLCASTSVSDDSATNKSMFNCPNVYSYGSNAALCSHADAEIQDVPFISPNQLPFIPQPPGL